MLNINREKALNIVIILLLIGTLIVTWISQTRINGLVKETLLLNQENQSLKSSNTELTEKLVTLENEVKKNTPILSEEILQRKLKEKGLTVAGLKADLLKRSDLIMHKPVLGGSMNFNEAGIHVLTDKWVAAEFDDGHINGYTLLKYDVKAGKLNWSVVDSYLFE